MSMKIFQAKRLVATSALGLMLFVWVGGAWGQTPWVSATNCIFLQVQAVAAYTRTGALDEKTANDALDKEFKRYANIENQPPVELVIEQIKSNWTRLEQPDLSATSRATAMQGLTSADAGLCWMDWYAKRTRNSFTVEERNSYLIVEREKVQTIAAANLKARIDDPKTTGRGARGG